MQAVVFEEFGGPEVLQLREIEEPHAGPGEVRVAVRAAGVNPADYKIRRGWFEAMSPTTLPAVPGYELAGVVDEVGEGVTEFAVGDEVVGWAKAGSYAQYAVGGIVAAKPANVPFEQAAALPVAGETSSRVLRELDLKQEETLLLHGAAGGVGTVAAQLAVGLGATVIGTASPANHDYLRSLGVIPVEYGDGLVERVRAAAPQGVDAVFDAVGKGALPASIELRGSTDRIVTIADPAAGDLGVTFSPGGTAPEQQKAGLAEQLQQVADGTLRLNVAETFPLADAARAQELSEAGHTSGKFVVIP